LEESRTMFKRAQLKPVSFVSIAHCGSLYGANRSLLDLLGNLDQHKYAPHVVFLENGPALQAFSNAGINVKLYPSGLSSHMSGGSHARWKFDAAPYSPWWYFRAAQRVFADKLRAPVLASYLRTLGSLVVHSNSSVIDLGWMLAKRLQCPHYWHLREYGAEDYGMFPDFGMRRLQKLLTHSDLSISISHDIDRHFFHDADPPSRHLVVYNGVRKYADFMAGMTLRRSRHHTRRNKMQFFMASSLHKAKGHDVALRAFAIANRQLQGAEMVIAGDGGAKDRLEALASELQIDRFVRFVGYQSDITPLLIETDALLMCSEREAMGRVTAEGMGYGVPVIGRSTGATVELIADGKTGLLYDGSEENLAEKMILLGTQQGLAISFSEASHADAIVRFTIEAYVKGITMGIDEVCSDRRVDRGHHPQDSP